MSESIRPPWLVPSSDGAGRSAEDGVESRETVTTVEADDGTRLFLRSASPREARTTGTRLHTFFCDGILCDGFIWKYLWSELAETNHVVHWHYRGHGRSGAPAETLNVDIAQHAKDLMAVRRTMGNPPCVLLGHSMGTQVCLEEWRLFPDHIRGIVLICGSYGKVTQSFRGIPILDAILPKLARMADKQPDLVRAIWSRIPPEMAFRAALLVGDVDPDNVRREDILPYLRHMTHVDFSMFVRMLRAAGEHSAEDYLQSIDVPVLIVAGERDTFTPGSLSQWMAEQIPGAELLLVPAGTHVAPIEQPELIGAKIRAFVDRVSAT